MKLQPLSIKLKSRSKYLRLLAGPPQTARIHSGLVSLKPGEEVGEHSTDAKEEVLIILKGKAKILLEKHPALAAQAGHLVYIPPHTKHNVCNSGSSILRYIYIVSRA